MTSWTRQRTARKPHCCSLCHRTIQPRETYEYETCVESGNWWTWHTCVHCAAVIQTLWNRRLLYEDASDQDRFDTLWESGEVGLLRLAVGIKRKWRRFTDDTLMAVPSVQPRRCIDCGRPVDEPRSYTWCEPCDTRRIERLNGQFADLVGAFAGGRS